MKTGHRSERYLPPMKKRKRLASSLDRRFEERPLFLRSIFLYVHFRLSSATTSSTTSALWLNCRQWLETMKHWCGFDQGIGHHRAALSRGCDLRLNNIYLLFSSHPLSSDDSVLSVPHSTVLPTTSPLTCSLTVRSCYESMRHLDTHWLFSAHFFTLPFPLPAVSPFCRHVRARSHA